MPDKNRFSVSVFLAAAVTCLQLPALHPAHAAQATAYPAKQVHIVVGYGAGGGGDAIARIMAQKLAEEFRRPVIVDNRPGASGNLGTEVVVRAPADGHTLLLGNIGPIAVNPSLFKLAYEPEKDPPP